MKIKRVFFEDQDNCSWFDSNDKLEVADMVGNLNDPLNDIVTYYTEDGKPIFRWPMDYNGSSERLDEYGSSAVGYDYSPSAPWNAPGMSVHDFV